MAIGAHLVRRFKPGETTGVELHDMIAAEAREARIVPSAMSGRILGCPSRIAGLAYTKGPVRLATIERVVQWLDALPHKDKLEGLDALLEAAARVRSGGARTSVGPGIEHALGSTGARLTGPMLLGEIQAFLEESGMGAFEFANRALGWRSINALETVKFPGPAVIARVRDFIAKRPAITTRSLTPSGMASQRMRDGASDAARAIEHRRSLTERAHAMTNGETLHDRILRISADELEDDGEADRRREAELADLASPSSLIRRAERDWPDQAARVAALAVEAGVQRGEAWRRVIVAGIESLLDGGL